jgi:hypothetical protein
MTTTKPAKTARAARPALSRNTLYIDRVVEALTLLCGGKAPARELVVAWEENTSEELQSWAVCNVAAPWGTGIGTIEAAQVMADTPEEGMDHQYRDDAYPRGVDLTERRDTSAVDLSERITAVYGDNWSLQVNGDGTGSLTAGVTDYFSFIGQLDDLIHAKESEELVPE